MEQQRIVLSRPIRRSRIAKPVLTSLIGILSICPPFHAQQGTNPSAIPNGNSPLFAALGLPSGSGVQTEPSAYAIKGTLQDASGNQYATTSVTSKGLESLRQEVSGSHHEILIFNRGVGSDKEDSGVAKKVPSHEAMRPFHLLPTVNVLQQLAEKAVVQNTAPDVSGSCIRYSLAVPVPGDTAAKPQTLVLCINAASHLVVYEEEPYSFSPLSGAHTLRRTFVWSNANGTTGTFPSAIQMSLDGQLKCSLQLTQVDESPVLTSDTFQVDGGAK